MAQNEAAVTMVMQMRDETSDKLKNVGQTMQETEKQSFELNMALTAVGSALTAVGALLGQIDSPMAKIASTFLVTSGAILTTTSAIIQMLPYIKQVTNAIRAWATAQAFGMALLGPYGWGTLAASLAVAGAAAATITAATGGFSSSNRETNINIYTQAMMANEQEARQLAQKIQRFNREDTRIGR